MESGKEVDNKEYEYYDGRANDIEDIIQKKLNNGYWNLKGVNAKDVLQTLEGIFSALAVIKTTSKPTIKVLRAHHPPFNLEGDFTGMWQYRSKNKAFEGKTFIEACKIAGVHLYLASHHHSAQAWSFPYCEVDHLVKNIGVTGYPNIQKYEKMGQVQNCFPQDCKAVNTVDATMNLNAPSHMYIALIGNSGRYFDPITPAGNSKGTLIFGRANNAKPDTSKDNKRWKKTEDNYYGGAIATFDNLTVKIEFYETQDKTTPILFDTLTLTYQNAKRKRKMKK